jgi:hypothetical protein
MAASSMNEPQSGIARCPVRSREQDTCPQPRVCRSRKERLRVGNSSGLRPEMEAVYSHARHEDTCGRVASVFADQRTLKRRFEVASNVGYLGSSIA